MKEFMVSAISFLFAFKVFASVLPPANVTEQENEKIWQTYCVGDRKSAEIPRPNYSEQEVVKAVEKLAIVSPYSYYFYSGPLYAYELKKGKELVEPPADFPQVKEVKNGKKNAHAFMTVLCGEFRDRPTLIKAKVRWVHKMFTLPATPQKTINLNHELWSQVSAESYSKYINNTRMIFHAKDQYLKKNNYRARIGKYSEDYPVEPFSVCETKFIFKRYVEVGAQFNPKDYAKYTAEFKKFKDRCSQEDLDYIYDFRGDSNFKPNSPESNGMIWYSSSITNNCTRVNGKYVLKEASKAKISDPEICEKYFKTPFAYRWGAARAGLASWLMRDIKHDATFANTRSMVTMIPNLEPLQKPFGFKIPYRSGDDYVEELEKNEKGEYVTWDIKTGEMVVLTPDQVAAKEKEIAEKKAAIEEKKKNGDVVLFDFIDSWKANQAKFWERPDLGFNTVFGLDTKAPLKEYVFERLRDAVNRHTDWYASGYDDGTNPIREQAYSPFVASSYEMSASDAFTAPGTTVQSPSDGCKHWMFVFKLKKDKWYNSQSIVEKKPVDFNYHWFDETTLGTNHLADSEHAFDRLGTALEGEMDVILYIHNITTGGRVDPLCGAEQMAIAPITAPVTEPIQPAISPAPVTQ